MFVKQWEVDSSSGTRRYVVSLTEAGEYQCGCLGWTRHTPRRPCKHIAAALSGYGRELDPLAVAVAKVQRRVERSAAA